MFLCITIFFQDKFAKVIGWLTWLRFCETCADLEWQPVWRSGYLILPLLHCTTNTIRFKCFHWCLTNTTKLVPFCSSALSSKSPQIFIFLFAEILPHVPDLVKKHPVRVVRQFTYIAAPICMWDLAPAQEGELAAGRFEGWQSSMSLIPSNA